MIWFGRCDAGERWAASTTRLAREVLDRLIGAALPFGSKADEAELVVGLDLAGPVGRAGHGGRGRLAAVTASAVGRGELARPIAWVGDAPPADALAAGDAAGALPFVRVEVRSRASGRPVGGVLLVADGIYTLGEVRRAVEASLEGGEARPGRYGVLASARRPLPTLRPCRGGDLLGGLAVCRCENPTCPSRGAEVLVPWTSPDPWGASADTVAYPCPSCPGPWYHRWALSWLRRASPRELLGGAVVDYRIPPTQRRRNPAAGPMHVAVAVPRATAWGGWTGATIPGIPAGLGRFLRIRRPAALRSALLEAPNVAGSLLSGLLTSGNLRAFVEMVRHLPFARRRGGVAVGLAHAFCPRRPSRYDTEIDATQASQFPYIALDPEAFLLRLHAYGALDVPGGRFLDVGCGVGEKVFLAYALGRFARCDGLEYDPRTAAVAEFLFDRLVTYEPYPVSIIRGDALEFDRYGDYDVIYMYRPLRDRGLMSRLARRAIGQMRPGAVLCDALQAGFAVRRGADGGFHPVVTPLPDEGPAEWGGPVTIDAFLEQVGLGAGGAS